MAAAAAVASSLEAIGGGGRPSTDQLQVTREKMEQLRRIMEERKAKRRARREARASPYSTSWSLKSAASGNDEDVASEAASVVSGAEAAAGQLSAEANLTAANLTSETGQQQAANSTSASSTASAVASASSSTSDMFNNNNPELEPVTA